MSIFRASIGCDLKKGEFLCVMMLELRGGKDCVGSEKFEELNGGVCFGKSVSSLKCNSFDWLLPSVWVIVSQPVASQGHRESGDSGSGSIVRAPLITMSWWNDSGWNPPCRLSLIYADSNWRLNRRVVDD
jgi:hypothetical protein